jgi:hypothetical protein
VNFWNNSCNGSVGTDIIDYGHLDFWDVSMNFKRCCSTSLGERFIVNNESSLDDLFSKSCEIDRCGIFLGVDCPDYCSLNNGKCEKTPCTLLFSDEICYPWCVEYNNECFMVCPDKTSVINDTSNICVDVDCSVLVGDDCQKGCVLIHDVCVVVPSLVQSVSVGSLNGDAEDTPECGISLTYPCKTLTYSVNSRLNKLSPNLFIKVDSDLEIEKGLNLSTLVIESNDNDVMRKLDCLKLVGDWNFPGYFYVEELFSCSLKQIGFNLPEEIKTSRSIPFMSIGLKSNMKLTNCSFSSSNIIDYTIIEIKNCILDVEGCNFYNIYSIAESVIVGNTMNNIIFKSINSDLEAGLDFIVKNITVQRAFILLSWDVGVVDDKNLGGSIFFDRCDFVDVKGVGENDDDKYFSSRFLLYV